MRILFFVFTMAISSFCLAQDVTNKKQANKIFSFAAGGTPTTTGLTYERILNNRKTSLEIGVGLLGGGLGVNLYQFKPFNPEQINSFIGVRSSFNIQGSGGSRFVNYLPIGVNYLSSKNLYFSIDLGPALIVQLSHNGYPDPNKILPDYPKYMLGVYGGIKFGFGF